MADEPSVARLPLAVACDKKKKKKFGLTGLIFRLSQFGDKRPKLNSLGLEITDKSLVITGDLGLIYWLIRWLMQPSNRLASLVGMSGLLTRPITAWARCLPPPGT